MTFDGKKHASSSGRSGGRLETLDLLRGLTLVSMILYHWMWDFLYLSDTGRRMTALKDWYRGPGGFFWQQSICWTFILLSGFCVPFSQRIFRRGLEVTAAGLVVSAVTVFLMYDERVLCGVLSFLGAAMILSGVLDRVLLKNAVNTWTREPAEQERPSSAGGASALIGFAVCCLLFYITRWVNRGFLQLWPGRTLILPAFLFTEGIPGAILTAVGFPMKDFFSTDYFSMIPWFFLFRAGFYLHQIMRGRGWFSSPVFHCRIPLLNRMGEHSLLIYMLHQPVLYLLTLLLF
ncbi:MAG: heparan-alpha-glucosaminide N-acetyltransferase domain-containing protein [Eubacteriales bacterium]|nr:heparan-alpha-glucosaminide N-acetyltransferase domain-containing protein [Eubacteriales bacterium]